MNEKEEKRGRTAHLSILRVEVFQTFPEVEELGRGDEDDVEPEMKRRKAS